MLDKYINALDEPERSKVKENMKTLPLFNCTEDSLIEYIKTGGFSFFISMIFSWSNTPEGWDYWESVCDKYSGVYVKDKNRWL